MKRIAIIFNFFYLIYQCFSQGNFGFAAIDNEEFVGEDFPVMFDLRNTGRLGKVKTQPNGGCWASASVSSVESVLLTSGNSNLELSDINLKLFHGFVPERSVNGNHYMATSYFSRGSGPIVINPETDSLYQISPELATYISDARFLPENPELIKQTIIDVGAVYSMMYFKRKELDTLTNIYYCKKPDKINHAINIIGWNDTINTKSEKGVWIAQNSLGKKFGEDGFFYIPYNDPNILKHNAVWNKFLSYNPNSEIYYYDTLGSYSSYGFGDTITYGLVKYSAKNDILISKVGTFINFQNTRIYCEIFSDFEKTTKTLSGKLGEIPDHKCKYAGYYTLDLDTPIQINSGNDFFIMMRYITPNDTLPLPVEKYIRGYSDPHITDGKCWVNPNFDKWPDTWYECGPASKWKVLNFDLCIKAYCIRKD